MTDRAPELHLAANAHAGREAVYDRLANADAHLDWAGHRQPRYFRLLSIEASDAPLVAGATFSSTGSIPGSGRRFDDRSRVTVAERPSVFEFVTEATVAGRHPMRATYRHRYELEVIPDGCRVHYTFREEALAEPMLRLSLPIIGAMTRRFGMPMMMRPGLRNLVRAAEARVAGPLALDPAE